MGVPRTAVQAGIFGSAKVIAKLISFVALLYFARVLGASHFGVYTYLLSLMFLIQPFSTLGMFSEVSRRSRSKTLKVFQEFLPTFSFLNIMSALVVSLLVIWRGYSSFLAIACLFAFLFLNLYEFLSKSHMVSGRVRYISTVSILERILFSIMVFIFPKKTLFLFTAIIISYFISGIYLWMKIKPKFHIRFEWPTFKFFSWEFFSAMLFMVVASRFPSIIYDWRFGITTLGNFGVAIYVSQGISLIVAEVGAFLVMRAGKFGDKQFKLIKKWTVIGALLITGLIFILNPIISMVGTWIFGSGFTTAGDLLAILAFGVASTLLFYYPRMKLVYNSPKKYSFAYLIYMISAVSLALVAKDIFQATIFRVISLYIHVGVSWILADMTTTTLGVGA